MVQKIDFRKHSLRLHKKIKGKLEICSKVRLYDKNDLSISYTPGVAAVCELIAKDKKNVFTHTIKANTVAVVSDGTAVLGLGNIGPYAAMPVMEGKAILFKKFGGIDAFPICLDTQDPDEIVKTVKFIAPGFGGINLEDISAPRCFEIEERLIKELDIPVFHDDQHGTAIITLAALINALKIVKKDIFKIKIVINGAGAAAIAITNMLISAGARAGNIVILDSKGIIAEGRKDLNLYKERMAKITNFKKLTGNLENAIKGADVFIGVSVANVLKLEFVEKMADNPVVFAMANPNPEISFENAKKTKIAIFGTGRSDYPNQINNVLAFPGVFRGTFDAGAKNITGKMKIAAAEALSSLISKKELNSNYIIPKPFDPRVVKAVCRAVIRASK